MVLLRPLLGRLFLRLPSLFLTLLVELLPRLSLISIASRCPHQAILTLESRRVLATSLAVCTVREARIGRELRVGSQHRVRRELWPELW